ncbi:MAG: hypothetical protein AABX04_05990 [Nanoarchaeota archaeon]
MANDLMKNNIEFEKLVDKLKLQVNEKKEEIENTALSAMETALDNKDLRNATLYALLLFWMNQK